MDRFELGGGITIEVSELETLKKTSDFSGSPGMMACADGLSFSAANAPSGVSNRNPAFRLLASGPWHLKHLSDRIGRICKLKSTESSALAVDPSCLQATIKKEEAMANKKGTETFIFEILILF